MTHLWVIQFDNRTRRSLIDNILKVEVGPKSRMTDVQNLQGPILNYYFIIELTPGWHGKPGYSSLKIFIEDIVRVSAYNLNLLGQIYILNLQE